MAYPMAYFIEQNKGTTILKSFAVPEQGAIAANVSVNEQLRQAFSFQPGMVMKATSEGYKEEEWEVMVSAYNEMYFYCRQHNDYAYFINNGTMFYFTNYFGRRRSLLFLFYRSAFKVLMSGDKKITITDTFPRNTEGRHPLRWIQDLLSPFYLFMKTTYTCNVKQEDDVLGGGTIILESITQQHLGHVIKQKMNARTEISRGKIKSFRAEFNNKQIEVKCES
jgi:hypothetical protein